MTLYELQKDYEKLVKILNDLPHNFMSSMASDLNIPRNWLYNIKKQKPLCPSHARIKKVINYYETMRSESSK